LEEFFAGLVLVSTAVGIQVFIQKFPHIVGERQDFQVFGVLESVLELLGHVAVVFGFLHDFADESLLAVQVVVVERFVQVLEHGDPLDDVESVVVVSVIGRPGVVVVIVVVAATVATVVGAAVLGFEVEVVKGDGGSTDDGQEDEAIGQDGSVDLHQAGGEVNEEEPGVSCVLLIEAEVVGTSYGR